MAKTVYINKISKYLPGSPIANEEMEEYLGYVSNKPSRSKAIILRNNGIKQRYYAIDKEGNLLENNAQLTAKAINQLGINPENISYLACGTTSPDQYLPAHANMVHGIIGGNNMEVSSHSGSCLSGFHALKMAYLNISVGLHSTAIATGSELFSKNFRHEFFEEEAAKLIELEQQPYIAFEQDFLRWMLSDGSSAVLLNEKPNEDGISLRIDWMDAKSFAHELETCMYIAGDKDGKELRSYKEFAPQEWLNKSMFAIKQDTKLLGEYIIKKGGEYTTEVAKKYNLNPSEIDWLLPHISSMFFYEKMQKIYEEVGFIIPAEKWFTNLTTVGNLGSAAFMFIMEELFNSGKLKKGQKILVMIPESARFAYGYIHLTVV